MMNQKDQLCMLGLQGWYAALVPRAAAAFVHYMKEQFATGSAVHR
jgi:hypothetical protein